MKSFAATTLAVSLIGISGCAQAGQSSGRDMKKADVEQIIQDYLMANPEILREALVELEKKEDRAALASVSDALFKDPRDVSIGPKNAKVTVVEFFDYNCGFCKTSSDWLKGCLLYTSDAADE